MDAFGKHELVDEPDNADLILFAERINEAGSHLEKVRKHPLVSKYRERCFVFNPRYKGIPFIPGVYSSIHRALYDPQRVRSGHYTEVANHDIIDFRHPTKEDAYLYSFVGSTNTHSIRKKLAPLDHENGLFLDTSEERKDDEGLSETEYQERYVNISSNSKFILCPRGFGPSTMRLFETMKMGRVPVIISDEWVPPEGPDWTTFSVQIAEADVSKVPSVLRDLEDRSLEMGTKARKEWEKWFSKEVTFTRVVDWCLDIMSERRISEKWLRYTPYLYLLHPKQSKRTLRKVLRS